MGLFDLFHRPSMDQGLTQWRETPDAVLLDVRTPEEYRSGHIPKAVNLPLDRLSTGKLPAKKPVFVYCLSGGRSSQACAWLKRQGFEAINLGGIHSYRGPLETKG